MRALIFLGIAILFSGSFAKAVWGGGVESSPVCLFDKDSCDFSAYKPLKEPHSLLKAVVKKVNPEYPPAARSVRASGKVVVRILINKKGGVVGACIVEGHPLLRAASTEAAKQWKFKKNFGLINYQPKKRFAETDLTFNIELPG